MKLPQKPQQSRLFVGCTSCRKFLYLWLYKLHDYCPSILECFIWKQHPACQENLLLTAFYSKNVVLVQMSYSFFQKKFQERNYVLSCKKGISLSAVRCLGNICRTVSDFNSDKNFRFRIRTASLKCVLLSMA